VNRRKRLIGYSAQGITPAASCTGHKLLRCLRAWLERLMSMVLLLYYIERSLRTWLTVSRGSARTYY
jgi:hypothetical protein